MFQGVFMQVGRPCPRIAEYVNDKSAVRARLAQQTGFSVDEVKHHLNSMHAYPRHKWPQHSSLEALTWVDALRVEIQQAYNILDRFSPLFKDLLAEARKHKRSKSSESKSGDRQYNLMGAAVSMFRYIASANRQVNRKETTSANPPRDASTSRVVLRA